jgi:BNR/Asp-box repeat
VKKQIGVMVLALGSYALLNECIAQTQSTGCRSLSERIWYGVTPPRDASSARIVTVEVNEGRSVLVTSREGEFYGTSDLGKNWTLLSGGKWTMWGHFPSVILAPSQPSTRYKYEPVGVIKRSQDGGATWIEPRPTIEGRSAEDTAYRVSGANDYVLEFDITAVHPLKPLTIYATVSVGPPRRAGGDTREQYVFRGMYVSEDGGYDWRLFSEQVGVFNKYPRRVVLGISPSNPDVMYSEGEQGILRSTDGGKTWRPVGQSDLLNLEPLDTEDREDGVLASTKQVPLNVNEFIFDPHSADVVYMRSRKGIHCSLNGGDTWTLLNLGFDRMNSVNSIAVDLLEPNRVFAGTDRGLFVSEDRGCTFFKMNTPNSGH